MKKSGNYTDNGTEERVDTNGNSDGNVTDQCTRINEYNKVVFSFMNPR